MAKEQNGRRFRSSAAFGKRQEYIAVAELLRRGFDVYMTLVDDLQIDCIVRMPGPPPTYVDVQIKARSSEAKNASTFSAMEIRDPRENFVFIFYVEASNKYWVIPSLHLVHQAWRNKGGENAGKYKIDLCNRNAAGGWNPRPKWQAYENAFHLIGQPEAGAPIAAKASTLIEIGRNALGPVVS